MKSTNEEIVNIIVDCFKDVDKDEQMYLAIELIVKIANEAGSTYCESVGIIESAKAELRELLEKSPEKEFFIKNTSLKN